MPEDETTPTTPTTPAAPDAASKAEIDRLNGLLATANAENTRLLEQVQTLEGQVDQTKQKELEDRLNVLESENTTLKTANDTLKGDAAKSVELSALAGKVRDPEAVRALLTDDLRGKDGTPDVEKIIAKYPYQAPDGAVGATAPDGAGGTQNAGATTLDAAVASKDTAAINAAFEAELKGASK